MPSVTLLFVLSSIVTLQANAVDAGADGKKIVCYYVSGAQRRTGPAMYTVEDIPIEMCTHAIYSFADLHSESLTVVEYDSYLDKDNGYGNYRKFLQLKRRNPEVKLLLGLGSRTDSNSDKYSQMVSNHWSRANFITHVVRLLKSYGFDGLDLNLEYSAAEKFSQDKVGFRLWIEELRKAFNHDGLLLTAAVPAGKNFTERGYDLPTIINALDQIHIMAFDFHDSWEEEVAHPAPLFPVPGQPEELSADFAVNYWIEKGAPARKLVLGVPFHGKSWTLSGTNTAPGALTKGPGNPGRFIKQSGTLAYYEICYAHEFERWEKTLSPEGPYLVKNHQWVIKGDVEVISTKGDQWVGYDDIEAVTRKSEYVKAKGLGGIMIWDITMDDFRGMCSSGPNPLMKAIFKALGRAAGTDNNNIKPITPSIKRPTHQKPLFRAQFKPSRQLFPEPINPMPALNVDECMKFGYTPDRKSCIHFYRCVGKQINHYRCPSGLIWDQTQRGCILEQKNRCKNKPML